MGRTRIVLLIVGILIILGSISASFFLGSKYALEHLSVRRVTPNELGLAMKTDHFFRTYRENTLMITGVVSRVDQKVDAIEITFGETGDFEVRCSISNPINKPELGSKMKLLSEAARAIRLPKGILLKGCIPL